MHPNNLNSESQLQVIFNFIEMLKRQREHLELTINQLERDCVSKEAEFFSRQSELQALYDILQENLKNARNNKNALKRQLRECEQELKTLKLTHDRELKDLIHHKDSIFEDLKNQYQSEVAKFNDILEKVKQHITDLKNQEILALREQIEQITFNHGETLKV